MNNENVSVACPNCGREVEWSDTSRFRPFCSERCQLLDLGEWAAENYRVPGDPAPMPDKPDPTSLQ